MLNGKIDMPNYEARGMERVSGLRRVECFRKTNTSENIFLAKAGLANKIATTQRAESREGEAYLKMIFHPLFTDLKAPKPKIKTPGTGDRLLQLLMLIAKLPLMAVSKIVALFFMIFPKQFLFEQSKQATFNGCTVGLRGVVHIESTVWRCRSEIEADIAASDAPFIFLESFEPEPNKFLLLDRFFEDVAKIAAKYGKDVVVVDPTNTGDTMASFLMAFVELFTLPIALKWRDKNSARGMYAASRHFSEEWKGKNAVGFYGAIHVNSIVKKLKTPENVMHSSRCSFLEKLYRGKYTIRRYHFNGLEWVLAAEIPY